jgi:hypothetical protein
MTDATSSAQGTIAPPPTVKPISLRFALGDIVLWQKGYNFVTVGTPLTAPPPDEAQMLARWQGLPPDADGLKFEAMPLGNPLPRLTFQRDRIRYVPLQYQHHFMDMTTSFEQYMSKWTSRSRGNIKRAVKKFVQASGREDCARVFRTIPEVREFITQARAVSAKTYQDRLLHAGLPGGDGYVRRLEDMAGHDDFRGFLLYHGRTAVAFILCLVRGREIQHAHIGYDPACANLSPGNVLTYFAWQSLFAEQRYALMEFGQGEGEHKTFYGTGSVLCGEVYLFRRTAGNTLFILLHIASDAFSAGLGKCLAALHLKSAIKKFLRRQ